MGDYYLVFVSGQQARKNNNNEVTSDIEQQTNEVFESIEEILKSAGTGMNNIVKAVI
ncbi:MAG: RidA family protein [Bacilli bacterium]